MNAIQQALDCLKNGNRSWEAMEILEKALAATKPKPSADDIHSCSPFCKRPQCVADREASKPAPHDFKEWFGGGLSASPNCGSCGRLRKDPIHTASKPEPQAQAEEPEPAYKVRPYSSVPGGKVSGSQDFFSAEQYREAIAKKDAALQACEEDAARYRWLRANTGAEQNGRNSRTQVFTLPDVKKITGVNLLQGSVAQHLDAAIDAAIAHANQVLEGGGK